jgi:hypothetical protein
MATPTEYRSNAFPHGKQAAVHQLNSAGISVTDVARITSSYPLQVRRWLSVPPENAEPIPVSTLLHWLRHPKVSRNTIAALETLIAP